MKNATTEQNKAKAGATSGAGVAASGKNATMKTYYFVNSATNQVLHRCQADSVEHAAQKFEAIYGEHVSMTSHIESAADYKAESDLVFEQMHRGISRREWNLAKRTPVSAFGF